MTGREEYPQSSRTRMNAVLLTDPDVRGNDDLLSLDEITGAILSQRSIVAELLLADVLTLCEGATTVTLEDGSEYDITGACAALAEWDGTYTVDAVGAALWREFLAVFGSAARSDAGPLYSVPFDPADPVGTPNTLNVDNASSILLHIGLAAKVLDDAGWGHDVALGDIQFDASPHGEEIPIPGGFGLEGVASVVSCCSNPNTFGPRAENSPRVSDDFTLREAGYPITFGNSFMMTLQFTDEGPVAQGVLTYGQLDEIESDGFTEQTELYSNGVFRPMLFTEEDVAADEVSSMQVVGNR
jgi:acyl-homoserine-lactone acylase